MPVRRRAAFLLMAVSDAAAFGFWVALVANAGRWVVVVLGLIGLPPEIARIVAKWTKVIRKRSVSES